MASSIGQAAKAGAGVGQGEKQDTGRERRLRMSVRYPDSLLHVADDQVPVEGRVTVHPFGLGDAGAQSPPAGPRPMSSDWRIGPARRRARHPHRHSRHCGSPPPRRRAPGSSRHRQWQTTAARRAPCRPAASDCSAMWPSTACARRRRAWGSFSVGGTTGRDAEIAEQALVVLDPVRRMAKIEAVARNVAGAVVAGLGDRRRATAAAARSDALGSPSPADLTEASSRPTP